MNTKKIPAFVMLLAGSVACIVTFINHYSLKDMLIVLILTLIIFLIIGIVIKAILDSFELPQDENKVDDEGEVVEKVKEAENEGNTDETEEKAEEEGTMM